MHRVGDTVELGGLTPVPEGMKQVFIPSGVICPAVFGHHGEGTPGPGEPGGLGKAPELDGNFPGAFNFIDGPGQTLIVYKGLISGIIEDKGLVLPGIINKGLQLVFRDGCAGGVVGKSQVDEVYILHGEIRDEVVFISAVKVEDCLVSPIIWVSCTARHDIGIQVNGVDRVGNGDANIG